MAAPAPTRTRRATRRLVLEAFIIMGSILAAFALDRWYDRRRAHAEEQQVLQGLHAEFQAARTSLVWYRDLQRRVSNSVQSTLDALSAAKASGAAFAAVPDTALGLLYIAPTARPSLGTLDGLVASARVGMIRDVELRNALASWGGLFEELAEEESESRRYVVQEVDPVLRERVDVARFRTIGLHLVDGTMTPARLAAVSRIPTDLEVIGVITGRMFYLEHGIDEYGPILQHIDRILQLIESSRGS